MSIEFSHTPVLLGSVLEYIKDMKDGILIDATFGLGGYSSAFLKNTNCRVFALDRDPDVEVYAKKLVKDYKNRFFFSIGKFSELITLLKRNDLSNIIGIVFDLGVSNLQLQNINRGFSFRREGPLDMRMSKVGFNAEDFINILDQKTIADTLYHYGDETFAKRIARAIVKERKIKKITTTSQLAEIIRNVVPGKNYKIDKATKSFQAIRMYVNKELEELKLGLIAAENILQPNGLIAVVSFHSHEDRIVKNFLSYCSGKKIKQNSKFLPELNKVEKSFKILTKKPIISSEVEIQSNPQSRSAKLRVAQRTNARPLNEVAA